MSRPPMKKEEVDGRSTGEVVAILVKRSAPDAERPRGPADREQRLALVEQKSAACYAQAELLALKMQRLATAIDSTDEAQPEEAEDATPETTEGSDDSVVVRINSLRAQTKIE